MAKGNGDRRKEAAIRKVEEILTRLQGLDASDKLGALKQKLLALDLKLLETRVTAIEKILKIRR